MVKCSGFFPDLLKTEEIHNYYWGDGILLIKRRLKIKI